MNDVALLQNVDFKKRVTDHVQNTFGSLIPEEALAKFVESEINNFFTKPYKRSCTINEPINTTYSHKQSRNISWESTEFTELVFGEVKQIVSKFLSDFFKEKGKSQIDKYLEELVELKEFKQEQVMGLQQLLLAMTAGMFYNMASHNSQSLKVGMIEAANNVGMFDLAKSISNMPIFPYTPDSPHK